MRSFHGSLEPQWDGIDPVVTGGEMLRTIRQDRDLSLMDLASVLVEKGYRTDASHLQRIEAGRIARPQQDTLEAILTAGLNAPFRLRRDVLAAYGYRLAWSLPTMPEVEEGRRIAVHELHSTTWPAYVMDHGQRMWFWNGYVPRLLGLPPADPAPDRFVGLTPLQLMFDPALGITAVIANLEIFRPMFLRMFKVQTQPNANEPWFHDLIERAHAWPGFTETWASLEDEPVDLLRSQPIFPIAFAVPGIAQPLRFRITLIYLALDPRFQVVHWIPFGASTMTVCADWAAEEGEG